MKKTIISAIVAIGTTVLGGLILHYLLERNTISDALWQWSKSIGNIFLRTIPIPLGILLIFVLILAGLIYRWLLEKVNSGKRAPHVSYREDMFEGVFWCWAWNCTGTSIDWDSLWCECPKCRMSLVYIENYDPYKGEVSTILRCDHCERNLTEVAGNKSDLVNRINRKIYRKIKTGEWQVSDDIVL